MLYKLQSPTKTFYIYGSFHITSSKRFMTTQMSKLKHIIRDSDLVVFENDLNFSKRYTFWDFLTERQQEKCFEILSSLFDESTVEELIEDPNGLIYNSLKNCYFIDHELDDLREEYDIPRGHLERANCKELKQTSKNEAIKYATQIKHLETKKEYKEFFNSLKNNYKKCLDDYILGKSVKITEEDLHLISIRNKKWIEKMVKLPTNTFICVGNLHLKCKKDNILNLMKKKGFSVLNIFH